MHSNFHFTNFHVCHAGAISCKIICIIWDFKKNNVTHFDNLNYQNLPVLISSNIKEKYLMFVFCCQDVCFKAPWTNQIQIYAGLKQLFEHLLQTWRQWPLLGTSHPCLLMFPSFLIINSVRNLYLSHILNCICLRFWIVFVSNFELYLSQILNCICLNFPNKFVRNSASLLADVSDLSDQQFSSL